MPFKRENKKRYSIKKGLFLVALTLVIPLLVFCARPFLVKRGGEISLLVYPKGREGVRGAHIAQMLDLSQDKRVSLHRFGVKEGEKRLLTYPMVQRATIKKLTKGALYVDLVLREPLALIGNIPHWALDKEGVLFPLSPFYSPKKLTTLLLDPTVSGKVDSHTLALAKRLCTLFSNSSACTFDLSRVEAPRACDREIIITLPDNQVLRVCEESFERQIQNYHALKKEIDLKNCIVDLRVSDLAFFRKRPNSQ